MNKKFFVFAVFACLLITLFTHSFASNNDLLKQGWEKLLQKKWREASELFYKHFEVTKRELDADPESREKKGNYLEARSAVAFSLYKLGELERKDVIPTIINEILFRREGGANVYCIILVQEMSPLKSEIRRWVKEQVVKEQFADSSDINEEEINKTADSLFIIIRKIEKLGKE